MIEKTGWKAIICNAPWAYFERGQEGVIVSEDGKTCETTVDDISRIKIIADENNTFESRSGSTLFKQKGSDLEDIVPLVQKARKHTYKLTVNNVELTGCDVYSAFTRNLVVKWILDEGTPEETEVITSSYSIITPTNGDFPKPSGGTLPIKVSATSEGRTYNASSVCAINSAPTETNYSGTVININSITSCKSEQGSCAVTTNTSSPLECSGTVVFTYSEQPSTYKVMLTGITSTDYYTESRCGSVTATTTTSSTSELSFEVSGNGITNVTVSSNKTYLTFKAPTTTNKFKIKASRTRNNSTTAKTSSEISIPTSSC